VRDGKNRLKKYLKNPIARPWGKGGNRLKKYIPSAKNRRRARRRKKKTKKNRSSRQQTSVPAGKRKTRTAEYENDKNF